MSISSAFNNALSGLNVASRRAEAVSNNVANAMTEGYSRQNVELSSQVLNGVGGGVGISAVNRSEHLVLTQSRREADVKLASANVDLAALERVSGIVGTVDDANGLAKLYSKFETSVVSAANNPSSTLALDAVAHNAVQLAQKFNSISDGLSAIREDADSQIGRDIGVLNSSLQAIEDLNLEIRNRDVRQLDTTALKDQRDLIISDINNIVPTKVVERDFGQVSLFTPTGGILLDGSATSFGFSTTGTITHAMTIGNGALPTITVDGAPVVLGASPSFFDGGSLHASFVVRDETIPVQNLKLDALAQDLVERLQSPAVDPTLALSDAGMFTDNGAQFFPANQLGLAARIEVNSAINPQAGGLSWKLRDGINAVLQGDVGNNGTLLNVSGALQASIAAPAGLGSNGSMSATGFAAEHTSMTTYEYVTSEDQQTYLAVHQARIQESEAAVLGVDSDREIQNLMEIEKAYAANARVMSVLDELLARLMEI